MSSPMTKDEFLARIENAWNVGLIRPETLHRLEQAADAFMRLVHCHTYDDYLLGDAHQRKIAEDIARVAASRLKMGADYRPTLANDKDGYDAWQLAALLSHPCQQCAVHPYATWTRTGFCEHKEERRGEDS